ncbi:MAG: ABC transporter ATP-binding protein [Acidimicrobiia bacterium]|nr:MAG: ABC transporter ATP-binding protein [Acidimicrobiia bacterium]
MATTPDTDTYAAQAGEGPIALTGLRLESVEKRYGDVIAVDSVDLSIDEGEFVSLLGPSGCGKTTTLRVIAGFEWADRGRIVLEGMDVTDVPPHKRDIGMVFQDYSLFPHMTVWQNVAFGLEMRRRRKDRIKEEVRDALAAVQLEGLEGRRPSQLSGGQQQRVALARALVIRPKLLLLDEPLSNLDAKLRIETRRELRQIQQAVGIMTLFVTHDQEEALALSDRVVVMNEGKKVQEGTPAEVYERPANEFVASFLGQENAFEGTVVEVLDETLVGVRTREGLTLWAETLASVSEGDEVVLVGKRERMALSATLPVEGSDPYLNSIEADVEYMHYLGGRLEYVCRVGMRRLLVSVVNERSVAPARPGDSTYIVFRPQALVVLPRVSKENK